jgi:hypothetical protein
LVEFEIFKNLRNFKIKNPKKTRHNFKNFDQNIIKKSVVFHPKKFKQVCLAVKSGKNRFDRLLLTHDHMGLILFLPYLSHTHAPPSHHRRRSNHRSTTSGPSVDFAVAGVGKGFGPPV